jgi:GT2 family glycosyltransferase
MLIKRGVIETIGVQDDRLFFGMDDVEYSLRASLTGWKNLIAYDAVIYHAGSQSVTPNSGLQVYYIFRNALQL